MCNSKSLNLIHMHFEGHWHGGLWKCKVLLLYGSRFLPPCLFFQTEHCTCAKVSTWSKEMQREDGGHLFIFYSCMDCRESVLHESTRGRIKVTAAKSETQHGKVRCSAIWTAHLKTSSSRTVRNLLTHHWVAKLESSATLFQHRQLLAGFPPLYPVWDTGALQAKTAYFLDIL